MPYPRFEAPPPPPADRPEPAPAPTPNPTELRDYEDLLARGVGAVVSFHREHAGEYARLHADYLHRASSGRARRLG